MSHIPVLLQEVTDYLKPSPGKRFIDATVGGGGHAKALVGKGAVVLALDWDKNAADRLTAEWNPPSEKCRIIWGDFGDLSRIAEAEGFTGVDGVLYDFGLSSEQLDDERRGFAFQKNGPLDMRFDQSQKRTAQALINSSSETELIRIFRNFGEEKRFARRVARAAMEFRKTKTLETTGELFELIKKSLPGAIRFRAGDAARRIFMSLRIAVNDELETIRRSLPQGLALLKPGGRLAAISFHSLEDRIVKEFMVRNAKDCICPPSFPICRCGNKAGLKILTRKPVTPSEQETKNNPRAHSAKLRVAEKI